jgi:hypothetical protein
LYDINNNRITGASQIGQVGLEWKVAGFGDFNGDGTTDMMLRNINTGGFEVYDINNGHVTSANSLGAVGNEYQVAGFGDFNGDGTTDMMLRNVNTGTFELYDINNNMITSAAAIGSRHSRARFSGPEASRHGRSSADCITNTCESEFSVHTTWATLYLCPSSAAFIITIAESSSRDTHLISRQVS